MCGLGLHNPTDSPAGRLMLSRDRWRQKAYKLKVERREKIILALGPQRIADAERRLCAVCRFGAVELVCGVDPLLLPLTSAGEDCPYYLAK